MNATCPTCGTTYRLDPRKIPEAGVRARCVRCEGIFPVARVRDEEVASSSGRPSSPAGEAAAPDLSPPPPEPTPLFGVADPDARARRLARALISDIVVYHPERRERAAVAGSLRQEFREEIRKSWEEYVSQVGDGVARGTPHFRDALNEILAGGKPLF